ncbi:MAG TPA: matrixin family metalloprotease [Bacillota bacterium]
MRAKRLLGLLIAVLLIAFAATPASAYYYTGIHWPYVQHQKTLIYYNPYPQGQPAVVTEINSAANSWNGAGANFQFVIQAGGPNSWGAASLDPQTGAETQYWYDINNIVLQAITNFNTNVTYSTNGAPNTLDIQSVAVHEFGHWLVLGHASATDAVMLPTIGLGVIRRQLTSDDVLGAKAAYPQNPPMP